MTERVVDLDYVSMKCLNCGSYYGVRKEKSSQCLLCKSFNVKTVEEFIEYCNDLMLKKYPKQEDTSAKDSSQSKDTGVH